MPTPPIGTLLIEDSGLMRIMLSDLLRSDPDIALLGTASNGKDGLLKARQLKPDVIITDMVMPQMDGLAVVQAVMEQRPVPVILLSALDKENPLVFEALSAGAFDFLNKEVVGHAATDQQSPLNAMIKAAVNATPETLGRLKVRKNNHTHSFAAQLPYEIIAVGASTGGPTAVEGLLNGLPANLTIPVVVAQHMPEQFLPAFANRLNGAGPLRVKLAERNEVLRGGTVYILPGHTNTKIRRDERTQQPVFQFTNRQFKEFNHPSVDCLFSSLAQVYGQKTIGVLLTGMGKDGTRGLGAIQDQQGYTIGQDESSCVVFGMPKQAIEAGVVQQVMPLREIPGFLVSCLS